MSVLNFMAIHQIVAEIFGPKWWTDNESKLPTLEPCHHPDGNINICQILW